MASGRAASAGCDAHDPLAEVTLRPPNSRDKEKLPNVTIWAVWAIEPHPPAGVEPIEWLLLTTVPITTTDEALERLAWYAARWGIEVWHKVLKSGCRIEDRQLETAERLIRCLTLYSVIAWRILYATMLARAVPDVPCTVLLDADEWQGLYCRIHRVALAPAKPPSLRPAVRWIAQLGGFPGRKRDGEPGVTVLWKGFQHLVDLTAMYRIMRPAPKPPNPTDPRTKILGKDMGCTEGCNFVVRPSSARRCTNQIGLRYIASLAGNQPLEQRIVARRHHTPVVLGGNAANIMSAQCRKVANDCMQPIGQIGILVVQAGRVILGRQQIGVAQATRQYWNAAAIHRLDHADAKELLDRAADDDIGLPQPLAVACEIQRVAPCQRPVAQPLARRKKVRLVRIDMFAGRDHSEIDPARRQVA